MPGQDASCAEVMAAGLQNAGVRSLFAYPGDPIIEFMEQCRQGGTDVVLATREGALLGANAGA